MSSAFIARIGRDYRRAAALYFRSGRMEQAARMYAKAGEPLESARLWLRSGRELEALEMLEKVHPERAAELLSESDQDDLAIRFFEQAGSFWKAAECARRLRRPLRAARLFERAGAWEQAASSYAEAGDDEEVLRVWQRHSRELAEAGKLQEQRRVDLLRAKRLVDAEEFSKAARLLERHDRSLVAAKLWHRSGHHERALAAYLAAGGRQQAEALLDELDTRETDEESPAVSVALRARVLEAASRHHEAAAAYEEAGDVSGALRQLEAAGAYQAAAERSEQRGESERAMELWLLADRPLEAARLKAANGELRDAAELARAASEHSIAANYYRELGDHLLAAQELIKGDAAEEAILDLRKLSNAADLAAGSRLLVPLLVGSGRYQSALKMLKVAEKAIASEEVLYWRARAHEGLDRRIEAIEGLRELVAQRPRYRDAEPRLSRLEIAARKSTPSGGLRSFKEGERLQGRYEIEEEANRGLWSRLYRARDVVRRQPVAVKLLSRNTPFLGGLENRLREEVRLCRRLKHPGIVRVFEHGNSEGRLFVVMEWAEGPTLQALLDDRGALSAEESCDVAEALAAGLATAHRERVVHCDLSPNNVIMTERGPQITDFGLALAVDGGLSSDAQGNVFGTPHFMSPEQIQGLALDGRSDLYSLGAILFTCLAGRPPFEGQSATAVTLKHLQESPPDLRRLRPDLSRSLIQIVEKLLIKDPVRRFGSAADLVATLQEWRERTLL